MIFGANAMIVLEDRKNGSFREHLHYCGSADCEGDTEDIVQYFGTDHARYGGWSYEVGSGEVRWYCPSCTKRRNNHDK